MEIVLAVIVMSTLTLILNGTLGYIKVSKEIKERETLERMRKNNRKS